MGYTTPNRMDLYSRTMARLFDEQDFINVPTGGQGFFGPTGNGDTLYEPDATVVDYTVIRGSKTMSPMILRGTDAAHIDSQESVTVGKFTDFNRIFPLIEDYGTLSHEKLTKRMAGEPSYGGLTQLQRQRQLAQRAHAEMVRRNIRTMEYLAWQSIRLGTMPALVGTANTDFIYDFERRASHNVASANWTSAAFDIMGALDSGRDLIANDGNVEPEILLCGDTAIKAIENNTAIQTISNNRRYFHNAFEVPLDNPALRGLTERGFGYRGRLVTTTGNEFYLFTYKHTYTATVGGTHVRLLPLLEAIMTSSQAIGDRFFGPGDELTPTQQQLADYRDTMGVDQRLLPANVNTIGNLSFDPRWWTFSMMRERKNFKFFSQIAPIFVPRNIDAWVKFVIT